MTLISRATVQDNRVEIIAISDKYMNWAEAKAWCEKMGGRLPLINGAASLEDWNQIIESGIVTIDGIGQIDIVNWPTPWPSGLPSDGYWSGTVCSDRSWYVAVGDGKVLIAPSSQSLDGRVVCVR